MGCGVLVGFEDAVMFLPVKMIVVMFFEILVVVLLCFFANTLDRPDGPVPCKENNRKRHFLANALVSCPTRLSSIFQHPKNREM